MNMFNCSPTFMNILNEMSELISAATYFCRISKFTLIHKIELKLFLLQKPRLILENQFKVSCLKAIETYIDTNIPK